MKHAGSIALDELEDVLSAIRARGLKEPRRGVFYRKGKALLHFHEDRLGLFADVRVNDSWERLCVSSPEERTIFIDFIDQNLSPPKQGNAAV